jgi:hypothetical protein
VSRPDALHRRNRERVDGGTYSGIGATQLTKCLADLRDTQAKLRQVQAGSSITTDQAFWYNLDDALYALEEITPRFAGADELEQVRERIIHWQNELATAHPVGCARTAA